MQKLERLKRDMSKKRKKGGCEKRRETPLLRRIKKNLYIHTHTHTELS